MLKDQELIQSYGLSDYATLTGAVANTELMDYFHSHDVYLNTTAYESFGLAVFEAAACGIPIISTRVGELPYLWNDKQNILFSNKQNGDSFAKAISTLFKDR